MRSLTVSVVVPAHNAARFVAASLSSIVAQSYKPAEVLVMDDASTDATPQIAASFGAPVRHVRQAINKGIYSNVNDGIAIARGDLIATYHADDMYEPTMIERQVRAFERYPQAGAVFCLSTLVDENNVEYGRTSLPADVPADAPLAFEQIANGLLRHKNRLLICPTAMVRAVVHREVGLYDQDTWRNSSDLDMWLRIAARYPIVIVGEHLIRYRHSSEQSSRRYHRMRTEPERFFGIMDHHLARGMRVRAAPDALRAYAAHRAEDCLIVAISRYVRGDRPGARDVLRGVRLRALLASRRVQRWRLGLMYGVFRVACTVPRSRLLATLLGWRWHTRSRPGKPGEPLRAALNAYARGRDPGAQSRLV